MSKWVGKRREIERFFFKFLKALCLCFELYVSSRLFLFLSFLSLSLWILIIICYKSWPSYSISFLCTHTLIYLFVLCWVLVAAWAFSSYSERGYSPLQCRGFSPRCFSWCGAQRWARGLRSCNRQALELGLGSCHTRTSLHCSAWDPPDRGWNRAPLYGQVGSLALSHQGSLLCLCFEMHGSLPFVLCLSLWILLIIWYTSSSPSPVPSSVYIWHGWLHTQHLFFSQPILPNVAFITQSHRLFVTPRTIQSMEFSRPEYWSG